MLKSTYPGDVTPPCPRIHRARPWVGWDIAMFPRTQNTKAVRRPSSVEAEIGGKGRRPSSRPGPYCVYHRNSDTSYIPPNASRLNNIYYNLNLLTSSSSSYPPLKLRIPRGAIRTLQRPLTAIPPQRTQLEPLLPATNRVHRPLMAQVHILANGQTLRVLIAQDDGARGLGLAHDIRRARIVQEAKVDAARVPRADTVRAAQRGVAHERMPAAVVV